MAAASELEKFIVKHAPKLKKSGAKFGKDLGAAAHEGAEKVGDWGRARAIDFGKAAVAEVAKHPILSAATSASAAAALATNGHHDDLAASDAGRALNAHKKKKRPYVDED